MTLPSGPDSGGGFAGRIRGVFGPRLRLVLAVVVIALLTGKPLMRAAAEFLDADDPAVAADRVVTSIHFGGEGRWRETAATIGTKSGTNGGAGNVLLVRIHEGRLQRVGVLPSWDSLDADRLTRAGVNPARISLAPGKARTNWDAARAVGEHLKGHPDERVVVLCRRFDGRRVRTIFHRALEPTEARRVFVRSLDDSDFGAGDWWKSRSGFKSFFNGWMSLVWLHVHGEDPSVEDRWNPDEFENGLSTASG